MGVINIALGSYESIISEINHIVIKIKSVNAAITEINTEKDVISDKIENTSAVAEEVSASSEVALAAEVLNGVTQEMIVHVNQFKI